MSQRRKYDPPLSQNVSNYGRFTLRDRPNQPTRFDSIRCSFASSLNKLELLANRNVRLFEQVICPLAFSSPSPRRRILRFSSTARYRAEGETRSDSALPENEEWDARSRLVPTAQRDAQGVCGRQVLRTSVSLFNWRATLAIERAQ